MSKLHGGWTTDSSLAADDILQLPTWSSQQSPSAETFGGPIGEHGEREDRVGRPETFQRDAVGSFPKGWNDVAVFTPASIAPNPSAVVVSTTDAFGHPTKALATLPAIAVSQGIYRPIEPSGHYMTTADVRVDQFGDVDRSVLVEDPNNPGFLLCGCPVGTENINDWPMQVGFNLLTADTTDVAETAAAGVVASSATHTWHLFAVTTNIVADIDLGIHIEEGKWYGVETDFDATTGALHGLITDKTTGTSSDKMVFVTDPKYGAYDPSVDGVFNIEAYIDGEESLVHSSNPTLTRPGLAVIDNIDVFNHGHGGAGFDDHHPSAVAPVWADWG